MASAVLMLSYGVSDVVSDTVVAREQSYGLLCGWTYDSVIRRERAVARWHASCLALKVMQCQSKQESLGYQRGLNGVRNNRVW